MASGWTRSRVAFVGAAAAFALVVLIWAHSLVLPFTLALLLAYVLTPAVAWCERRGIPSALSVVIVYLTALSAIAALGAIVLPLLTRELVTMRRELPQAARQWAAEHGPELLEPLNRFLDRGDEVGRQAPTPALVLQPLADGRYEVHVTGTVEIVAESSKHWQVRPVRESSIELSQWLGDLVASWVEYARTNVAEVIRVGRALASTAIRGLFLTFMMMMCAAYLIHTRGQVLDFFRSLAPPVERPRFDRLLKRLDRSLNAVVRGQLLICLVNGVLSGVGFALLELKYWPILTLLATVLSIIPVFGALLSSIPALLVAFLQGPWVALWTLLWIVGIHQLEAQLLNPKIIGTVADLHPVLVVFALLLGEHTLGVWGALLALPALALCQALFNHFRTEYVEEHEPISNLVATQVTGGGPTADPAKPSTDA